jgi:hypothetical protein
MPLRRSKSVTLRERVERLCRTLERDELRELAGEIGAVELLDEILDEVRRAGADGGELAARLVERLDLLDETFARADVESVTGALRQFRPVNGIEPAASDYALVCPRRICPRGDVLPATGSEPLCAVLGVPLTRVRMGA